MRLGTLWSNGVDIRNSVEISVCYTEFSDCQASRYSANGNLDRVVCFILGMSDSNQRQCVPQTKDDCRRHAGAVMSVMVIVQRHSTTVLESDIITRTHTSTQPNHPVQCVILNSYSELQAPTLGSWSSKLLGANFELLK